MHLSELSTNSTFRWYKVHADVCEGFVARRGGGCNDSEVTKNAILVISDAYIFGTLRAKAK